MSDEAAPSWVPPSLAAAEERPSAGDARPPPEGSRTRKTWLQRQYTARQARRAADAEARRDALAAELAAAQREHWELLCQGEALEQTMAYMHDVEQVCAAARAQSQPSALAAAPPGDGGGGGGGLVAGVAAAVQDGMFQCILRLGDLTSRHEEQMQ